MSKDARFYSRILGQAIEETEQFFQQNMRRFPDVREIALRAITKYLELENQGAKDE